MPESVAKTHQPRSTKNVNDEICASNVPIRRDPAGGQGCGATPRVTNVERALPDRLDRYMA